MNMPAYLLRLTLRDIEPPIWREALVPAHLTLPQLHKVIQILFDWTDSHLWQFE